MRRRSMLHGGYAVMLVLVFNVLFLAMLSVAYRGVASALRAESARTLQVRRDEGATAALARGLALLETGLPPSNPYLCCVTLDTSAGPRSFTVTFTLVDESTWTVRAAPTLPGENPPLMPDMLSR